MKIIKIKKHEITFYSGIKDMPIRRYNQMQSLLLQDVGIGSSIRDFEKYFKTLDAHIGSGDLNAISTTRQNMLLALYSNIEGINYKSLAFACLIHAVDGKEINDPSDEGLKELINSMGDSLTVGEIETILEDLKKNCVQN